MVVCWCSPKASFMTHSKWGSESRWSKSTNRSLFVSLSTSSRALANTSGRRRASTKAFITEADYQSLSRDQHSAIRLSSQYPTQLNHMEVILIFHRPTTIQSAGNAKDIAHDALRCCDLHLCGLSASAAPHTTMALTIRVVTHWYGSLRNLSTRNLV